MQKKLVIAIDGPAGSGKSTAAKLVAARLGYLYLDTGAMYRALTLKAMEKGTDMKSGRALALLAARTRISLRDRKVFLDGRDVSGRIRDPEVSRNTHYVSVVPGVRARMKVLQRKMGGKGGIVAEGRDIGTVVFPSADRKFFLVASPKERARRRHKELKKKGFPDSFGKVLRETLERDRMDSTRKIAPLRKADDAVLVDTTRMKIAEVARRLLEAVMSHE
ncbi:cytidylate kinase [Candidatus Desantisbacteria bacterium CG_4_10_14_0_8_um_filter_48_22]|uniref:Cytidylate kinase n=1 Tax=Candidatus Desantisbacteria bacterium CG_4_10_14_0_8_um_filter_48_22 TaxID=1974543 RepID=A0A2M7SCN7_9BACT|nr:MAG: cytidylate kinase [Candidatus Desantisbacteria bacterium CG1_02_49_89]PIV54751.1 MAG: cytidylate kinase [Candidatus Desantisbacteria bacterium CG02_land_8_20_14_3_00_49_13]PIZ17285.1 MAG: cytidylate kinase [Candidatus Desantisbacteria bacterium CG_4_10_14_0_8_um_filter_48_22]